jgi:type 1 glutamine amidotransferase
MKHALIVWGGWPGHEPEASAEAVAGFLGQDGFAVDVASDYARLGDDRIGEYDLVVPIITNDEIDRDIVRRLSDAVRAGTGLGGHHAAMATSFRSVVEFHFLCGVQWVAHPGNIIDFRVNVTRPDDPVVAGVADFDYCSEQYYLHYDPSIEILATTTFSGEHDEVTRGVVMPVVFKRRFGKGRIFYSALGHVPAELAHPAAQTMLRRGLSWAAR